MESAPPYLRGGAGVPEHELAWRAPELWFGPPRHGVPAQEWRHPALGAAHVLSLWPVEVLAAVQSDVRTSLGVSELEAWLFVLSGCAAYGGHHPTDAVQTNIQDQFVDTAWPQCPGHPHPMEAFDDDDFATWRCPTTRGVIARVGALGELQGG